MSDIVIGASIEATASVYTAGEKVLALHALIASDITDAAFRAQAKEILGPTP